VSAKNEHLVVTLFEPVKMGEVFIDWPLHTTIVPWFAVEAERQLELHKLLSDLANQHKPISIKVGKTTLFGINHDLPVNIVEPNNELIKLHRDVFNTLETNNFPIHQKTYCGDGYQAHITQQKQRKIAEGENLEITKLALIRQTRQKVTGTMVKELTKEYELSGKNPLR
jgi:2'-5' RNA ligase